MSQPLDYTVTIQFRLPGSDQVVGTNTFSGTLVPSVPAAPPASPAGTLGARVKFGAFVHDGSVGDPWNPGPHRELERRLNRVLDPVSCFVGWDVDLAQIPLAANYGKRDILISWHPDQVTAADILAGKWDPFLTKWAASADNHTGGQLYVRLMPEMNGNWSRWSAANGGMGITSPQQYVRVWQYVVDKVSRRTNKIKWVWCPNVTDEPGAAGNRLEEYWPGSSFVHVLGFDGYNWGDSNSGGFRWTSFADLVGKPQGSATKSIYDRLAAINPTMPIWLCETGCKDPTREDGPGPGIAPVNLAHSKAQWYIDMLRSTEFLRLTTVVAFDVAKERDWRLTSSPGVAEAVAANLTK